MDVVVPLPTHTENALNMCEQIQIDQDTGYLKAMMSDVKGRITKINLE